MQLDQLKIGDILFYRGSNDWKAKVIRCFDGTDAHHVSVYLGDGVVLEATGEGVHRSLLKDSMKDSTISAYRLDPDPEPTDPVIASALKYEGKKYAMEQILFIGILSITRKIPLNREVIKAVNRVLKAAGAILLHYTKGNKRRLICSELVVRGYHEAIEGNDDRFTIVFSDGGHFLKKGFRNDNHSSIEEGSLISYFYDDIEQRSIDPEIPLVAFKELKELQDPDFSDRTSDEILARLLPDETMNEILAGFQSGIKEDIAPQELFQQEDLKKNFELFLTAYQSYATANTFLKSLDIRSALKTLMEDLSDFVTPGELYKGTTNLQKVCDIQPGSLS